MILTKRTRKIKAMLLNTDNEIAIYRLHLIRVLNKAGIEVIEPEINRENPTKPVNTNEIFGLIDNVDCSIQIIGNQYGNIRPNHADLSYSEYFFREINKHRRVQNEDFKVFVWHPFQQQNTCYESRQEQFITSIKNSVSHNIIISFHETPVLLAEDIHLIMESITDNAATVNQSELFFIYNELDEESAPSIIELLNDVVKVESYMLSQSSIGSNTQLLIEQINAAQMAVVYYKWSVDWAIPFTQQIWRLAGGASSQTPVLLIGDNTPEYNRGKEFVAPNIDTILTAGELIPLEIKVRYDQTVNKKIKE